MTKATDEEWKDKHVADETDRNKRVEELESDKAVLEDHLRKVHDVVEQQGELTPEEIIDQIITYNVQAILNLTDNQVKK